MITNNVPVPKRLFSLDVFRGLIMFLLIAEAAGFHESFAKVGEGTIFQGLALQLQHHPWHGLRFWDLIQPFFMFIVGVAMPFSVKKRLANGQRNSVHWHMLERCVKLFIFGLWLHWIYALGPVWELWNVLVQLAFTIMMAYAIMERSPRFQLLFSMALLFLTELLYRTYDPSAPYEKGPENFGAWMDLLVMGKINEGHWVFINFLPTAVHTIWGVICGKLLLSGKNPKNMLTTMLIWGMTATALGYGMDFFGPTPIIKRIATSSFTLVSGGIAILTLVFFYWVIDIRGYKRGWLRIFSVVGTNSILIYLIAETFGRLLFRIAEKIVGSTYMLGMGMPLSWMLLFISLSILFALWYITYFLDKRGFYYKV